MSTLQIDTLAERDGSESVPVDTVIHGSAKAWVNFNGTGTVAIRSAFNVANITDLAVGQYQVNFAVPMPSPDFAVTAAGFRSSGNEGVVNPESYTTGSVTVNCTTGSGSEADFLMVSLAIFR